MSIAFERSAASNSIHRSRFIHDMPLFLGDFQGDRRYPPRENDDDGGSSSSSSIGRNSDLSSDGDDSGEDCEDSQVRSFYTGGPLDTMAALEEVLPIKRGISKFYSGKSKSFTSLADASTASSIEDVVKPENRYTRKRKNQLARGNLLDDMHRNSPPKENANSCISKKPSHGFAIKDESQSRSSSRPPLHPPPKPSIVHGSCSSPPRRSTPWRSFSLSDLHCAAGEYND